MDEAECRFTLLCCASIFGSKTLDDDQFECRIKIQLVDLLAYLDCVLVPEEGMPRLMFRFRDHRDVLRMIATAD